LVPSQFSLPGLWRSHLNINRLGLVALVVHRNGPRNDF
jgi:hypothetical protein